MVIWIWMDKFFRLQKIIALGDFGWPFLPSVNYFSLQYLCRDFVADRSTVDVGWHEITWYKHFGRLK